ncbi:uncharacterized protein LOC111043637 [Nilaparvata lugens]|uniref:uncharacterized protein LOC111043637 n=1 Tax=Nilaparvata lugens TaxID=108931 RepID=UPI00193CC7AB|nr:uncharacterized protein LOC111043637 [Nilaparvata lugens]
MPRERRLRGINSSAVRHRISFEDEDIDIESVLERTKTRVFEIIREHAARYDANVKWYIVLNVLLYKLVVLDDKVDESVSSLINLHSYSNIALNVLENYEDFNDNSGTGYIIECDLEYPKDLHDKHASFPLAPLHLTPPRELLSEYQTNENGQGAKVGIELQTHIPKSTMTDEYAANYSFRFKTPFYI